MNSRPDHGETSYRGSEKLAGKKALITGGDSGIGRAAAIAYAREGADVAINYLPAEEPDAREVVKLIEAEGRMAVAIPGDLRDEAFCRSLVQEAREQLSGLGILVNNAAPADPSRDRRNLEPRFRRHDEDQRLRALLAHQGRLGGDGGGGHDRDLVRAGGQPLARHRRLPHHPGGGADFAKGVAKQLAPRGIRVNAVAPGPFWTPLQVSGGATAEKLQTFDEDSPMGRPGQPAEVAALYVAAADPLLNYSTGQIFGSSGGNGQPA